MKLNTRARYSLRLMHALTQIATDERPVALADVAKATGITRRYLDQLVIPLRRAGLLVGRSGRDGGYTITRPPEEISLRQIIDAADGEIALAECVDDPARCGRSGSCHCRRLWSLITHRIRDVLEEYTLMDFSDPDWLVSELSDRETRRRPAQAAPRRKRDRSHTQRA